MVGVVDLGRVCCPPQFTLRLNSSLFARRLKEHLLADIRNSNLRFSQKEFLIAAEAGEEAGEKTKYPNKQIYKYTN